MLPSALSDLHNISLNSADTIMHSIAAILQPHTSSPSVLIIAHAMANLMAANIRRNDLDQVLSAHLDSLAISPQAKQAIFPTLLGIAKFTEVHAQARRYVHLIRCYSFCPCVLIVLSRLQCYSAAGCNRAAG